MQSLCTGNRSYCYIRQLKLRIQPSKTANWTQNVNTKLVSVLHGNVPPPALSLNVHGHFISIRCGCVLLRVALSIGYVWQREPFNHCMCPTAVPTAYNTYIHMCMYCGIYWLHGRWTNTTLCRPSIPVKNANRPNPYGEKYAYLFFSFSLNLFNATALAVSCLDLPAPVFLNFYTSVVMVMIL